MRYASRCCRCVSTSRGRRRGRGGLRSSGRTRGEGCWRACARRGFLVGRAQSGGREGHGCMCCIGCSIGNTLNLHWSSGGYELFSRCHMCAVLVLLPPRSHFDYVAPIARVGGRVGLGLVCLAVGSASCSLFVTCVVVVTRAFWGRDALSYFERFRRFLQRSDCNQSGNPV